MVRIKAHVRKSPETRRGEILAESRKSAEILTETRKREEMRTVTKLEIEEVGTEKLIKAKKILNIETKKKAKKRKCKARKEKIW